MSQEVRLLLEQVLRLSDSELLTRLQLEKLFDGRDEVRIDLKQLERKLLNREVRWKEAGNIRYDLWNRLAKLVYDVAAARGYRCSRVHGVIICWKRQEQR